MAKLTLDEIEDILMDIPASTAAGLCGFNVSHLRRLTRDGWFHQKENRRYNAFRLMMDYRYVAVYGLSEQSLLR